MQYESRRHAFNFPLVQGAGSFDDRIVLAIAPLLALLYRRSEAFAGRLVAASSLAVVFAGSFWFVERLFP